MTTRTVGPAGPTVTTGLLRPLPGAQGPADGAHGEDVDPPRPVGPVRAHPRIHRVVPPTQEPPARRPVAEVVVPDPPAPRHGRPVAAERDRPADVAGHL